MHRFTRRAVLTGSLAGFCSLIQPSTSGRAQEQAVKIIYPFSAGGSGDAVARMIAEHLQTSLHRPVVVENRTGAAGRAGVQAVKDAPADGSVLLFAAGAQLTLLPHFSPNLGYDPFVDLTPISQTVMFDQALVVSGQLPVRSINELLAWFKANPDQAVYGSPGAGTGAHFVAMEFARVFDLNLRHVPYRGTPAALPDVLAGRVPMYIASSAELIAHHRSGGLRVLATVGSARSFPLPDVPTLKESGVHVEAPGWFAFYAPGRTPREMVERLEKDIVAATHAPETRAKILGMGFQPTGTSAATLMQIQRAEFERWAPIVKASGYKATP
jgi:tripartite-type tricarboxylate transporter receptor subunit TctC